MTSDPLEQILQTARSAAASGGPTFLVPGEDPRWRPAPDPSDGALRFDPEFTLPTIAGPLIWRLFYDSASAAADSEWGYGRRASFPLRLVKSGTTVTVMHEDGSIRAYNETSAGSGVYAANPQSGGDTLVTLMDDSWDETLGATGLRYHYPAGNYVSVSYRATPQEERITYSYAGNGQLESVQDPVGRRVTLSYNSEGKVQAVEDWAGRGLVVLTYGPNGELTELWEQEGVVTRYLYDSDHRPTYILDPAGFATTYMYEGSSGRVLSRSVDGHRSEYSYASVGPDRIAGYVDPLGREWTHLTSDVTADKGYPTAQIDPLGNRETYTYVDGQALEFENALGHKVSFAYDSNGYFHALRDELGNRMTFMRDSSGNVVSVINALGHVTTLTYTTPASRREVEAIIDPLERRTTFGYYSTGLPQYVVDPAGFRTTFVWNNRGELTSMTNARGFTWTYSYDAAGNRIETIDPLGYRWTYRYDNRGRLISEQTPLGHRWTTVYDTRDLMQAEVDPLGFRVTYVWDAEGNITAGIDELGQRWTRVYDPANQLTASIDSEGRQTSFYYDLAGRMTVIQDALGDLTTLVYNAADYTVAHIDPLGHRTSFGYDAAGRICTEPFF